MLELPWAGLGATTSWLYAHGSSARAPYVSAHITVHRNSCAGQGEDELVAYYAPTLQRFLTGPLSGD